MRAAAVAALAAFAFVGAPAALARAAARHGGAEVVHDPIRYFVPGKRIRLEAGVRNAGSLEEVRCYFRAVGRGDFVFAPMKPGEKDRWTVLLPAPVATTTAIQYRIEALGRRGVAAKTQTYFVERRDTDAVPAWQEVAADEAARLGDGGAARAPEGFSDGRTAGQEAAPRPASPAAKVAAAKAAGGGVSTTALLGAAAGIAVVGGGVALATGGGGGGDDAIACDQAVHAGGDAPEEHRVDLGRSSGTFGFGWDMDSIPDRMQVVYDGRVVLDTGCVSGSGYRGVPYSGSAESVRVVVTPNCGGGTTGTWWQFQVDCP